MKARSKQDQGGLGSWIAWYRVWGEGRLFIPTLLGYPVAFWFLKPLNWALAFPQCTLLVAVALSAVDVDEREPEQGRKKDTVPTVTVPD